MNKKEIYEHLGYNTDLYNNLADIFELEEDYQDKAWDKLTEICKYIYKTEKENNQLKEIEKEHQRINGELREENKLLKEKINTYENLEDLTLMFMYCDEKAKDNLCKGSKLDWSINNE